jgi:hypothetical protein
MEATVVDVEQIVPSLSIFRQLSSDLVGARQERQAHPSSAAAAAAVEVVSLARHRRGGRRLSIEPTPDSTV